MDPKLQIRIQRYGWDAASELYEEGWRGPLAPAQRTLLRVADHPTRRAGDRGRLRSGLVTKAIAEAVGPSGEVLADRSLAEHDRSDGSDLRRVRL